jgi:hypothetical protein
MINFSGTAPVFHSTQPRREKTLTLLDDPANRPDPVASQFAFPHFMSRLWGLLPPNAIAR